MIVFCGPRNQYDKAGGGRPGAALIRLAREETYVSRLLKEAHPLQYVNAVIMAGALANTTSQVHSLFKTAVISSFVGALTAIQLENSQQSTPSRSAGPLSTTKRGHAEKARKRDFSRTSGREKNSFFADREAL